MTPEGYHHPEVSCKLFKDNQRDSWDDREGIFLALKGEGIAPQSYLEKMERPRRLSYAKPPRLVQSGVQIVSIEDRNPHKNIGENVRKLISQMRSKMKQVNRLP